MMRIGAHQSIGGGIFNALIDANNDTAQALQIFTKSSNQWNGKPLDDETVDKYMELAKPFGVKNIVAHSSYLINLASMTEETLAKSKVAVADELARCDKLMIDYFVMHPGSHGGSGVDIGVTKIVDALDEIYANGNFNAITLLETTAGQGASVGSKFEDIKAIIDKSDNKTKLGVCLDSCHIYAAGYDIVNDYEGVISTLFDMFGDKIKVIHINDSKKELGSKVDRHACLGQGFIGEGFFRNMMNDKRFESVLGVLETPIEKGDTYKREIELLRSYVNK